MLAIRTFRLQRLPVLWLALVLGVLTSCRSMAVDEASAVEPATATLELVGTVPVESEVDGRGLTPTHTAWIELIEGAERTLDLAHFYASNQPGSRLEPVILAVRAAAERGVRVRFLAEEKFYATYPETLDRLAAMESVEVRRLDLSGMTGGVLHAKLLLVDGERVCVGSANFDWRSLEHIQELGVRVDSAEVAGRFERVFETDWSIAGGASTVALVAPDGTAPEAVDAVPVEVVYRGAPHRVTPVFSPRDLLPEDTPWDLPLLLEMIEGAEERVRVQLLSYYGTDREGRELELQRALLDAAARGVKVELMLAHWSKRRSSIGALKELQQVPGVEVRLVTVPEHSGGFIPFGRVIHSKYMVVDGAWAWIGTSNWSRDYFYAGRNAGLVIEGAGVAAELDGYFAAGWNGPYAEVVDPDAEYEAPRVGE